MALTTFESVRRGRTPATSPVIEASGLVKRYGQVEAVRGIDLAVGTGELFGFLGPNGAGKSTTIQMLCTLVRPTGGSARVAGFDVVRQRSDVRRHIGLVFQESTLDGHLTAEQNLRFHADVYGMARSSVRSRTDAVLEMVGLADRRGALVRTFSGGMKRRLEIARGLLHSPRVLFLDEPTIGLDPESRAGLWRYVDRLRAEEDITVFLTTHYMDEAERCDRIAIVDDGRIGALDTPSVLKAGVGHDRVRVDTTDDDAAEALLQSRLGVETTREAGVLTVLVPDGEQFVPRLFELGLTIRSVDVTRPTLDDVFLAHTGSRLAAGPSRGGRR
ncbi:ATP-binding cassette domain-containing protein [Modestobacter sp. I12A-02628]|uniref:ATP-binding cassette domain-containing protein n=1 Tax=Goekera deserti TaxID=2497753 RepID=A0A7K3WIF8_9ACTN|nr:ATP-binding cassette domain-containing protein [Goekera deserti]MPQ96646.1 ATP-binding cassette domain-containing protein [Goekera deserti]NDI47042.1 ATP-binding cassette domain-containing protein [Goekera deserti]NEL56278.1 ATP-binding cassette domain-containing protein [Goekera deserti]